MAFLYLKNLEENKWFGEGHLSNSNMVDTTLLFNGRSNEFCLYTKF